MKELSIILWSGVLAFLGGTVGAVLYAMATARNKAGNEQDGTEPR